MDERFSVFVRDESRPPDASEVKVAEYGCYGEARSLCSQLGRLGQCCVIRATGSIGGSD